MLYTVIVVITFLGYGYCLYKSTAITINLSKRISINRHWSGRIGINELKSLKNASSDLSIKKDSKRAIHFIKVSYIIAYTGISIFVVLMLTGYN